MRHRLSFTNPVKLAFCILPTIFIPLKQSIPVLPDRKEMLCSFTSLKVLDMFLAFALKERKKTLPITALTMNDVEKRGTGSQ